MIVANSKTCVSEKLRMAIFFAQPKGNYYPFGKEARGSSTVNDPKEGFIASNYDIESKLNYVGARYHNSEIGRWISVDPISAKYPSSSPYVYTANNPVNLIDSRGMDWYQSNSDPGKYVWFDGNDDREGYSNMGTQFLLIVKGEKISRKDGESTKLGFFFFQNNGEYFYSEGYSGGYDDDGYFSDPIPSGDYYVRLWQYTEDLRFTDNGISLMPNYGVQAIHDDAIFPADGTKVRDIWGPLRVALLTQNQNFSGRYIHGKDDYFNRQDRTTLSCALEPGGKAGVPGDVMRTILDYSMEGRKNNFSFPYQKEMKVRVIE